jgi:hypothetical protein
LAEIVFVPISAKSMHHSEIGKIVDIFQELHILSTENHPVKIAAYSQGIKASDKMGIRLVTALINGYVTVEIDSQHEDGNGIKLFYFTEKSQTEPYQAFAWLHRKFSVVLLQKFMKKLVKIDKGLEDISQLKNHVLLEDDYKINCSWRDKQDMNF